MLVYSLQYSDILKRNNEQTRLAQNDFHEKLKLFRGVDLLEVFVEQKRTGIERPGMKHVRNGHVPTISRSCSILVALQYEDIDHMKTSIHLTNSSNYSSSMTPDTSHAPVDELIAFEPSDIGLPSFQAHFPVSSPTMSSGWPSMTNMKKSESNRGECLSHPVRAASRRDLTRPRTNHMLVM
jgi:hypothetical protein